MNKTVVFVHGAWVTPACWTNFKGYYEARGYRCIAPAWPHDDRPVAELQKSPAPELANLGVNDIVDHYARIIKELPEPPILVGHSFGGLFVQLLLDRGLGSAGIAIDPGSPRFIIPGWNAIRSALFILLTWFGWKKIISMPFENFQWSFIQNQPEAEQRAAWESQVVPTPGKIYFQAVLGIDTAVNFKNATRAPLLLIAGGEDRTVTPWMVKSTFKRHAKSSAVTAFKEFPGRSHWLIAAPGWEEIAAYGLHWAEERLSAQNK